MTNSRETYKARFENLTHLVQSGVITVPDLNERLGRKRTYRYIYAVLSRSTDSAGRPRTISETLARQIEAALNLEPEYLDRYHPATSTALIPVEKPESPRQHVKPSASNASNALSPFAEIPLYGGPSSSIAFSRPYVEKFLHGRPIGKLRALNASSDEFKPLLTAGDLLFYDSSDLIPRPGVFVLRPTGDDSGLIIRRLSRDLVGGLNLSADNLPGSIPFDPGKLTIEGRAIYALRGLEL